MMSDAEFREWLSRMEERHKGEVDVACGLNGRQLVVLRWMYERESAGLHITLRALAEGLAWSGAASYDSIRSLVAKGFLEGVSNAKPGCRKSTKYRLVGVRRVVLPEDTPQGRRLERALRFPTVIV